MKTNPDYVRFLLPQDRELQFGAMAMIQCFVARYPEKMKINHVLPTSAPFELHYMLDISDADLEFWHRIGLVLVKEPEVFDRCDMEIDMREDRVAQFQTFDRHVCQIYGSMCGVEANPIPDIRRVKPAVGKAGRILRLDYYPYSDDVLMTAQDNQFSCAVGRQSYLTWWTVAMGLPTIEIVDENINKVFKSKWASTTYRIIEAQHIDLLDQAIEDLLEVSAAIEALKAQQEQTKEGQELAV